MPEDMNKIDNIIFGLNEKPFPYVKNQSKIIVKKITEKVDEFQKTDSVSSIQSSDNKSVKQQVDKQIQLQPKKPKLEETKKIEKMEIEDTNLVEEVEKLKRERSCAVCMDRQKVVMFMPCSHLAACVECSVAMTACPICRKPIQATIRTYI